ncbi:uncharacterized protein HMPREF1541_00290 [Cyphellophora europaea CBS 101466]|uniref:Uncharacterized protein n=1 Tax=Cyphellophora europaea (strain CBS 101466) TaxID=1220924 RepID=W2SBJ2_CYPE1|nr:uncharacterized protein HMPREF1541_00290 [Cyphellophora europaea CBS 101466]ETN46106.1 hypothetical protein HMPREF1541_00290 [Cyphellophora europaea CBS 101466]
MSDSNNNTNHQVGQDQVGHGYDSPVDQNPDNVFPYTPGDFDLPDLVLSEFNDNDVNHTDVDTFDGSNQLNQRAMPPIDNQAIGGGFLGEPLQSGEEGFPLGNELAVVSSIEGQPQPEQQHTYPDPEEFLPQGVPLAAPDQRDESQQPLQTLEISLTPFTDSNTPRDPRIVQDSNQNAQACNSGNTKQPQAARDTATLSKGTSSKGFTPGPMRYAMMTKGFQPDPQQGHVIIGQRPAIPRPDRASRLAVRQPEDPNEIFEIGSREDSNPNLGMTSGRNWMGYFDPNDPERLVTRCRLRIRRGRGSDGRGESHSYLGYDSSREILPAGLSLEEICELYPNHVWGEMLRIFLSEGWTGASIFEALPGDVQKAIRAGRSGAPEKTRPQNYMQAACGREIDKMANEDNMYRPVKSAPNKGKKRKSRRSSEDDQEDDDDDVEEVSRHRQKFRPSSNRRVGPSRRTTNGAGQVRSQGGPSNRGPPTVSLSEGFSYGVQVNSVPPLPRVTQPNTPCGVQQVPNVRFAGRAPQHNIQRAPRMPVQPSNIPPTQPSLQPNGRYLPSGQMSSQRSSYIDEPYEGYHQDWQHQIEYRGAMYDPRIAFGSTRVNYAGHRPPVQNQGLIVPGYGLAAGERLMQQGSRFQTRPSYYDSTDHNGGLAYAPGHWAGQPLPVMPPSLIGGTEERWQNLAAGLYDDSLGLVSPQNNFEILHSERPLHSPGNASHTQPQKDDPDGSSKSPDTEPRDI